MRRELFIVARDRSDLYRYLSQTFADAENVEVIFDRRSTERREHSTTAAPDEEAVFVARATVWRALDTLTPRRRGVVVMHELEGLTIPAIASLLGVSAVTVRWHLFKGRGELARVLRSEGGERHGKR